MVFYSSLRPCPLRLRKLSCISLRQRKAVSRQLRARRFNPLSLNKTHNITLIDDGLASLAERIALIDKAQKTLDLEYFIYELDLSSQLVARKKIAAANCLSCTGQQSLLVVAT